MMDCPAGAQTTCIPFLPNQIHCAPCHINVNTSECGYVCNPTCSDGVQNQGEDNIDCGGPNCGVCVNCTDGILNNNETGIDCGGPNCDPCANCIDCTRDANETGFNCGGNCIPCATTCNTSNDITCPLGAFFIQSPNPAQADAPCMCYCPPENLTVCGPEFATCENVTRSEHLIGSIVNAVWINSTDDGYISSPCSNAPLFGSQCSGGFGCNAGTSGGIQVVLEEGCLCDSSDINTCNTETGVNCTAMQYHCGTAIFCPCVGPI